VAHAPHPGYGTLARFGSSAASLADLTGGALVAPPSVRLVLLTDPAAGFDVDTPGATGRCRKVPPPKRAEGGRRRRRQFERHGFVASGAIAARVMRGGDSSFVEDPLQQHQRQRAVRAQSGS
jgi:hypothetical protein